MNAPFPSRQLRNRDATQPAHRPRPALASSARGVAKQELRRQRELEANETFARANEVLDHVSAYRKKGSNSSQSQNSGSNGSQADSSPPESSSHAQKSIRTAGIANSDQCGDHTGQHLEVKCSEEGTSRPIIVALEEGGNGKRRRPASSPIVRDGSDIQSITSTPAAAAAAAAAADIAQILLGDKVEEAHPPPLKKRHVNIEDEFDDSGYWEDDFGDDETDWDAVFDQSMTATQIITDVANLPAKSSDATFIWAGKKGAATLAEQSVRAKEIARKVQDDLESEFAMDVDENTVTQNATTRHAVTDMRTPLRPSVAAHANNGTAQISSTPIAVPFSSNFATPRRTGQGPVVSSQAHRHTPFKLPVAASNTSALQQSPSAFRTPISRRRLGVTQRMVTGVRTPLGQARINSDDTPNSHDEKSIQAIITGQKSQSSFTVAGGRPTASVRNSFKSPFKKGHGVTMAHRAQSRPHANDVAAASSSSLMRILPSSRASGTVFDLDHAACSRRSLAETSSSREWTWQSNGCEAFRRSEEHGPMSTILAEPHQARKFCFSASNGDILAVEEARISLAQIIGRDEADFPFEWVRNHYGMIVWKLAAQAFHSSTHVKLFCWAEIMRQLRYRFEREFIRAHRSAIKRVQEQDSAPSSPLILCVYGIDTGAVSGNSVGSDPMQEEEAHLVLTDGWYRIRALIDEPLKRAVKQGLIKQGRKLAIVGARLDPSAIACDPIEGFAMSPLTICGNGTKLAPWHARLGFARNPFVATLRSLTADGGVVPLMDFVVVRAYPRAYMKVQVKEDFHQRKEDMVLSFIPSETWSAIEEEEKQREWTEQREKVGEEISLQLEEDTRKLEEIVIMLQEACEDLPPSVFGDIDENICNQQLDAMEKSNAPQTYLRTLSVLPALLRLARSRLSSKQENGRQQYERELEKKCPSRTLRSFRMLRVCDTALVADKSAAMSGVICSREQSGALRIPGPVTDKSRKCLREGLLRVWDVDGMGEREPKQGGRYRVTNLMPQKSANWSRKADDFDELSMSTRRDSQWRELPMPCFTKEEE